MDDQDVTQYKVVVNDEAQYSIWLADRAAPPGWHEVGHCGTKEQCLDYVEEVWRDMRPLSLRKLIEAEAVD